VSPAHLIASYGSSLIRHGAVGGVAKVLPVCAHVDEKDTNEDLEYAECASRLRTRASDVLKHRWSSFIPPSHVVVYPPMEYQLHQTDDQNDAAENQEEDVCPRQGRSFEGLPAEGPFSTSASGANDSRTSYQS
jgi:hypothetical protein